MKKHTLLGIIVCISFLITLFSSTCQLRANTVEWKVAEKFGIDTIDASPGTIKALAAARTFFNSNPNDTLVLSYPAGKYNFMANAPTIDFGSSFKPGNNGRLIIQGAGYESTSFISKDRKEHSIYGRNIYRVLFKGIHFTRDYCTVTQGDVVSVAPGEVVLDLHPGFPTPDSLMAIGRQNNAGLYLRKYTDDREDPHIIPENNKQIAWDTSSTSGLIEDRLWKFELRNSSTVAPYQPGDIVGVKLKHGGQTYWFCGGDDIRFESCKWTRKTRGVLRCGISNVSFVDCHFDRGPKVGGRTPCLASPGGGPQIGQPYDDEIYNVLVENCTFISSGDDNVALFNVADATVRNNVSTDAFARGILLHSVRNICMEDNVVERCPVLWEDGDGFSKCNWDYEPPSDVTGLAVSDTGIHSVTIVWNPANDNRGVEVYEVYQDNKLIESSVDTIATVTGLQANTFYYLRVLAVDSTGNKSPLRVIGVTTKEDAVTGSSSGLNTLSSEISLFPNPVRDQLHIRLPEKDVEAMLSLTDLSGSVHLYEAVEKSEWVLNTAHLEKGVYLVQVITKGDMYCKKLIIK